MHAWLSLAEAAYLQHQSGECSQGPRGWSTNYPADTMQLRGVSGAVPLSVASRWACKAAAAIQALGIDARASKMLVDHMPASVGEARAVVLGGLAGASDEVVVLALLELCDM